MAESLEPKSSDPKSSDPASSGLLGLASAKVRAIFDLESSGRLMVYSAIVGIVAGLGAAAFFFVLHEVQSLVVGEVICHHPPPAGHESEVGAETEIESLAEQLSSNRWMVLLVPTIGGLLCGMLVYGLAPEAEGHGSDAMIHSFHRLRGMIRGRVPFVKALASVITIGSGGSAGREGPIAQIGAGFGSLLAGRLKLTDFERRQLMLAGAAGGIAAIFQAPLGGSLFVVEVLYASAAFEFAAIIPAVISSVVAFSVFTGIYPNEVAFVTPKDLTFHAAELPLYFVFAIICAVAGFLYVSVFFGLRDRVFRRLKIPNFIKPAIGGALLGGTALLYPYVMGGGYGWIQQALDGNGLFGIKGDQGQWQVVGLMASLVLAKIVATSFTISSGGSGGVFAPSLFIGAMLGGAYGWGCQALFGEAFVPEPNAYVLVGMGGFFAGVAKVPLTALIMVCEMSGSYNLLVPLMLVCIINVAMSSARWTMYEEQVISLIDSPAHLGDFVIDVLARIRVRSVYQAKHVERIPQDLPLPKIMRRVANANSLYFPVVDDEDNLVGIFSLRDVRSVLHGSGAENLIVAADIATFPVLTVTPEDDLHTALRRFTRKNIDELPVVDADDPRKIVGMLRRKEVIGAYDDELDVLRHEG